MARGGKKKKNNLATGWLLLAAQEAVSLQPLPAAAPEKTLLQQLLPPSEGQRPHNFPAPTQLVHI